MKVRKASTEWPTKLSYPNARCESFIHKLPYVCGSRKVSWGGGRLQMIPTGRN